MSGHEVARRIRAQPGGSNMTLFALTGWGQDGDQRRSQQAGFVLIPKRIQSYRKIRSP